MTVREGLKLLSNRMSFEYLTSIVMNGTYTDTWKHRYIVRTMLDYVKPEEVKGFYPKNLFSDNLSLECFVFTDKRLLIFNDYDKQISIKVLNLNQITAVNLEREKNDFPNEIVKINFSSGEELEFDPKIDSNSSWCERFKDNVTEIFKLICQAP